MQQKYTASSLIPVQETAGVFPDCYKFCGKRSFCGNGERTEHPNFAALRRSEECADCADEVRVETCGKSARNGVEASVAVNSIRSNTVEETRPARLFPRRWLERTGNDAPR